MYTSYQQKQDEIIKRFSTLPDKEARYLEIIQCAKYLSSFPESEKKDCYLVKGCQSLLYVTARLENKKIYFNAYSDSLISKGLAGLLCYVYSDEDPKTILLTPPEFLQKIDVFSALSMNRSQGLKSLFTQMQKIAVPYLA